LLGTCTVAASLYGKTRGSVLWEWEKKNNHRKTVENKKNKTEVQEMEMETMELLNGM
jgi:hypothetical protein